LRAVAGEDCLSIDNLIFASTALKGLTRKSETLAESGRRGRDTASAILAGSSIEDLINTCALRSGIQSDTISSLKDFAVES
jgi:hypothetical protein